MNKVIKLVFNILIVAAAVAFLASFVLMLNSFKYRKEQDGKAKTLLTMDGLNYKLKHKAYGELTNVYFTDRFKYMEAPKEVEVAYSVSEYANTAFLKRVYEEKKDEEKMRDSQEKLSGIRATLGDYTYAANEIDEILQ